MKRVYWLIFWRPPSSRESLESLGTTAVISCIMIDAEM